jgi:hypothetical protein
MFSLHHDTPHERTGSVRGPASPTAGQPRDGTVASRRANAVATQMLANYNDRGHRLENLCNAVTRCESDLALAKRAPGAAASKGALLQIVGRLHRARMELAQLQSTG